MKPVRARDAATLILVRGGPAGPEVLLGRRPRTARFMPGLFVFPGGGLEPGDRRARPATPLDPALARRREIGATPARARALAMAAVRETAEETGLLLAGPGEVGAGAGGYAAMRAAGLAPALDALRYLGRAITPAARPIRFHARFFVADARRAAGRIRPSGELEEIAWVPLADRARVRLPIVTLFMLDRLAAEGGTPDRLHADRPTPLYTWRAERERVTLDRP